MGSIYTNTSSYGPADSSSVYSPFNRTAQSQQAPAMAPPSPGMAADSFNPSVTPPDMDKLSSSIDDKLAQIRALMSGAPAPQTQAAFMSQPAQQPQAPAVPQADIQWALELEQKVQGQNYQPNPQETARYEDIAKKLQAQASQPQATQPAANGSRDWSTWSKPFDVPGVPVSPTPIAQPNGKPMVMVPTSLRSAPQAAPTPVPATLASPPPQAFQPPSVPQAPAIANGMLSQADIQWALDLEKRVNDQRYQPNPQETARYEGIARQLMSAQGQAQAPAVQPPTTPIVPNNYPAVQPTTPQMLPQPQYQPPQPQMQPYPQAQPPYAGYPNNAMPPLPPQQEKPGFLSRLKNGLSAFWTNVTG